MSTLTQWAVFALLILMTLALLPSAAFAVRDRWCCLVFIVLIGSAYAMQQPSIATVAMLAGLVYASFRTGAVIVRQDDQILPVAYALFSAAVASMLVLLYQADVVPRLWNDRLQLLLSDVIGRATRQRNHFASLQCIALLAVVWCAGSLPARTLTTKALLTLAALAFGAANAASSSRTGALQLLALLFMVWCWGGLREARTRRIALTALVSYVSTSIVIQTFASNPSTALARAFNEQSDCHGRMTLWSNVWQLIQQRPWIGWGWGELDYAHYMAPIKGERFCEILDNAHNLPLHLAVELGLPFAALVSLALLACIWKGRPWAERDAARQFGWGVLALIGIHSLLEYPLWYGPFLLVAGLAIGLLYPPQEVKLKTGYGGAHSRLAGAALSGLMLSATLYAAWDYDRIRQIFLPVSERKDAYKNNTLQKIQGSWLFRNQVRFAELVTTPLTGANAEHIYALAQDMLHFSPEPRVIEQLIASARLTGREQEAAFHEGRFAAAFPQAYEAWRARGNLP